ncbi:MAG: lipoyl synthase [Pseudomonadota bacterium]
MCVRLAPGKDTVRHFPPWIKSRLPGDGRYYDIRKNLKKLQLATVCEEARCPNLAECWGNGTATFMILGQICTRSCRFCAVKSGKPEGLPSLDEPERVVSAIRFMGVQYAVITSVDRDDLPDGGAQHFVRVTEAIRKCLPDVTVELLTPDFNGDRSAIEHVGKSGANVLAHNVETVPRLSESLRDARCSYERSLEVLREYRVVSPKLVVKSSVLLGLGETQSEIQETMKDLRTVGVDWITFGQYLQPSRKQVGVKEFVTPAQFDIFANLARGIGFRFVSSGPLVRSSYRAAEQQVQEPPKASSQR